MNYLRYVYLSVLTFIMMFYQNVYAMEVNSIELFTGVTPEVIRKAAGYLAIFPDAPENAIKKMISSREDFKQSVGEPLFKGLLETISPVCKRGRLVKLPDAVKALGSCYMSLLIEDAQSSQVQLQKNSTIELGKAYALFAQLSAKGIEYNPTLIMRDLAVMGDLQNNFLRGIISGSERIAQRTDAICDGIKIPVDVADVFKMRIKVLASCFVILADSLGMDDFLSHLDHAIVVNGYYCDFYSLKTGDMLLHKAIRLAHRFSEHLVERMDAKFLCHLNREGHSPLSMAVLWSRIEAGRVIIEKVLSGEVCISDRFFKESLALGLYDFNHLEPLKRFQHFVLRIIQRLPIKFFNKSVQDGRRIQTLLSYAAKNNLPELLEAINERKEMEIIKGFFLRLRERSRLSSEAEIL